MAATPISKGVGTKPKRRANLLPSTRMQKPALRGMVARLPPLSRGTFALRTDSNLAQLAAVQAGFGIGLCHVAIASRNSALTRVLPSTSLLLPLWIVMHEDLKTSARYRVVFDALSAGLALS